MQKNVKASTKTTDEGTAPRVDNNRRQPAFKSTLLRAKCATSAISSPMPSTPHMLTIHGAKMTKCTVCAASTGPLQLNEYVAYRQCGTPGPACTRVPGAKRSLDDRVVPLMAAPFLAPVTMTSSSFGGGT